MPRADRLARTKRLIHGDDVNAKFALCPPFRQKRQQTRRQRMFHSEVGFARGAVRVLQHRKNVLGKVRESGLHQSVELKAVRVVQ